MSSNRIRRSVNHNYGNYSNIYSTITVPSPEFKIGDIVYISINKNTDYDINCMKFEDDTIAPLVKRQVLETKSSGPNTKFRNIGNYNRSLIENVFANKSNTPYHAFYLSIVEIGVALLSIDGGDRKPTYTYKTKIIATANDNNISKYSNIIMDDIILPEFALCPTSLLSDEF